MTALLERPKRQVRLAGKTRKAVLVVHFLSAGAWFGIDLALVTLVVTALTNSELRVHALSIAGLVAIWPMFTASLICLASGVVLSLGSKYGLVRYWWVLAKLAINIVFSILIVSGLRITLNHPFTADIGSLLGPSIVAPTLLLTAYFLSTFKPWGRINLTFWSNR